MMSDSANLTLECPLPPTRRSSSPTAAASHFSNNNYNYDGSQSQPSTVPPTNPHTPQLLPLDAECTIATQGIVFECLEQGGGGAGCDDNEEEVAFHPTKKTRFQMSSLSLTSADAFETEEVYSCCDNNNAVVEADEEEEDATVNPPLCLSGTASPNKQAFIESLTLSMDLLSVASSSKGRASSSFQGVLSSVPAPTKAKAKALAFVKAMPLMDDDDVEEDCCPPPAPRRSKMSSKRKSRSDDADCEESAQ